APRADARGIRLLLGPAQRRRAGQPRPLGAAAGRPGGDAGGAQPGGAGARGADLHLAQPVPVPPARGRPGGGAAPAHRLQGEGVVNVTPLPTRPCLALPFTVLTAQDRVRLVAGEDFRYTLTGPGLETWLPDWLPTLD